MYRSKAYILFINLLTGEVAIEMVGCFKDDYFDRALPVLYANVRPQIDWTNMNETVRQCADAAANHDPRKSHSLPVFFVYSTRR